METNENYLEINRESWNNKVGYHLNSEFYDMASFRAGKSTLNDIELSLLGNVEGKKVLHLQCHFGQDSISLARLGAEVTGVDLSDTAIDTARQLSEELGVATKFICTDVYSLPNVLTEKFDIVFTSYGALCWLPDLEKWSAIVSHFLNPGGKLVLAEFHPAVWMFDDHFETVAYSYFNEKPIVEISSGTYADKSAPITQKYVLWNHSLEDVLGNILRRGMQISKFREFDYSPYNFMQGAVESEPGKYRIEKFGSKLPLVFALSAVKN